MRFSDFIPNHSDLIALSCMALFAISACSSKSAGSSFGQNCNASKTERLALSRTLGTVQKDEIDFFSNQISITSKCIILRPVTDLDITNEDVSLRTDDTARIQKALFNLSQSEGERPGGILYLKASDDASKNTYRLARLSIPSNIRIVIDPEVTLLMIGSDSIRRQPNGDPYTDAKGFPKKRLNQHLFAIGNSEFTDNLNPDPIRNVEIISSSSTGMFTIDQRSEFPLEYRYRLKGQLRDNGVTVIEDNPQEYGITSKFAAPFYIGYAENIAISNVNILDNYTYLPAIAIYPDADMKDGIIGAKRHSSPPRNDRYGNRLERGMLIDANGDKVTDMSGFDRNQTYGRTLSGGAFKNIASDRGHGGFGLLQLWAGNTVYMEDLHGTGGITVRLEPGAGIENISRSGPGIGDIHTIRMEEISVRDGYTALWLKPHSKENSNIRAKNLSAYDSGSTIIFDTTSQDKEKFPDLHEGRFADVKISGVIHLSRENESRRAEVGYIPTLAMHIDDIKQVTDIDGYTDGGIRSGRPDGQISTNDLIAGPSGDRWFLVDPIVPIIAFNQMSENQFAASNEKNNKGTLGSNFYDVDLSEVTITRNEIYPIRRKEDIVYRSDMRRLTDGRPARNMINK